MHSYMCTQHSTMGTSNAKNTVCVTGAGGFIGSWIVKYLLVKGYHVIGTLRDPDDNKNSHLKLLEGAKERLKLCKADLLDYNSLCTAFKGCNGVFHTASPVTNDPEQVKTAVDGTKNVINAAADVGIRRVVFTSSFGAVHMNPGRSPDMVIDESCWSDLDFCRQTGNWYVYAKMMAELCATDEARERKVELMTVVPHLTVGPMLQSTLNVSLNRVLVYMTGKKKEYLHSAMGVVDVRDVARAHILLYESSAASGRYLCVGSVIHKSEFVEMLAEMFPEYLVTSRGKDKVNPRVKTYKVSNQKLIDLGLQFSPIENAIYEAVKSLQDRGFLPHPKGPIAPENIRSSL